MGEPGPYQVLGIPEDASFEEIKAARDQLMSLLTQDERQQHLVEQAYDSILMQRLRLRQEGKITVPDRIRFPERTVPPEPELVVPRNQPRTTSWLARWIDQPSSRDILLPLGIMVLITLLAAIDQRPQPPSWQIALGLMTSFYFLYRKERRFGRALLLAFGGLLLGMLLASGLTQVIGAGIVPNALFVGLTLLVMWLITAFLR